MEVTEIAKSLFESNKSVIKNELQNTKKLVFVIFPDIGIQKNPKAQIREHFDSMWLNSPPSETGCVDSVLPVVSRFSIRSFDQELRSTKAGILYDFPLGHQLFLYFARAILA